MSMIYRYNRNNAIHAAAVSVTDNLLNISVTPSVPDESVQDPSTVPCLAGELKQISISLDQLKSMKDFDDGAMLSFNLKALSGDGEIAWRNLYIGTYVGRRKMLDYLFEIDWNTSVRILIPAGGITSLRQCKYVFQMTDANSTLDTQEEVTTMSAPDFNGLQFVPEISGPASASLSGGQIDFSVQLKDCDGANVASSGVVYIESTGGALSKSRVNLDSGGAGTFSFSPSLLGVGEAVKIKSGFRYFAGANEKLISIAE
jgi:hypothetical protein